MRRLAVAPLIGAVALSLARPSQAQAPDRPVPDRVVEAPAASATTATAPAIDRAAPAAAPSIALARAPVRSICIVGQHPGVSPESAWTAASLVCDDLRRLGVPVAGMYEQDQTAGAAFRIELERLDRLVVLRITYEAPIGTPEDSRSAAIAGLDEVLVAGHRVAEALVTGQPLDETAEVDTLVAEETRRYGKKSGETFFGIGLAGFAVPTLSMHAGSALDFAVFYETPAFGVGSDLRVTVSDSKSDAKHASVGTLSLGGRGFLGRGDFGPFVGGGVAYSWMSLEDRSDPKSFYDGSGDGFGAYAEVGLEMLRFYKTRFLIALRLDVPFYSVPIGRTTVSAPSSGASSYPTYATSSDSMYALPVSLGATFAF